MNERSFFHIPDNFGCCASCVVWSKRCALHDNSSPLSSVVQNFSKGIVRVSGMEETHEEGASRAVAPAAAAPAPAPVDDVVQGKTNRRTAPSTSFEGCRPALSQEILEVVKEMGFESMTPVQVRVRVSCGV